jgi:hypothetical protein
MIPHKDGMPSVWVSIQLCNAVHDLAAHGVQMNVSDQFQKIGILFNHDTLVSVLKKMALSVMPPIVPDRITCHQSPHHSGEAHPVGSKKKMKMIGHETPCKQLDISLRNQVRKALEESLPVFRIPKDVPALDTPGHHMLKHIGYV